MIYLLVGLFNGENAI